MDQLKQIPKFIYVLLITIVVVIVFWLTIGTSLVNNAPTMIAEHDANVKKIAEYDDALSKKDAIEEEIKTNQATFEKKQKELFVDLETSTKEIEQYCHERNITLTNYTRSDPKDDDKNRLSTGGYPVKSVDIALSYKGNYDTVLGMLKYFEKSSKGCYYITSCNLSPKDKEKGGGNDVNDVSMNLTLYYYDTTATAQTATEAATAA